MPQILFSYLIGTECPEPLVESAGAHEEEIGEENQDTILEMSNLAMSLATT